MTKKKVMLKVGKQVCLQLLTKSVMCLNISDLAISSKLRLERRKAIIITDGKWKKDHL